MKAPAPPSLRLQADPLPTARPCRLASSHPGKCRASRVAGWPSALPGTGPGEQIPEPPSAGPPATVRLFVASSLLKAWSARGHPRAQGLAQLGGPGWLSPPSGPLGRRSLSSSPSGMSVAPSWPPGGTRTWQRPPAWGGLLQCPSMRAYGQLGAVTAGYGGCALGKPVDETSPLQLSGTLWPVTLKSCHRGSPRAPFPLADPTWDRCDLETQGQGNGRGCGVTALKGLGSKPCSPAS